MAWIPEPLYKKLPAAYALAGCSLIAAFGPNGATAISALALFLAAGLTAWWRYQHREVSMAKPESEPSRQKQEWAQRKARGTEPMKFK